MLNKNHTIYNKIKNKGFGIADALLSLTLLAGIITYGVYFSSVRLNTVYSSNLIRSINKEIERDIERIKLDLWSLFYNKNDKQYIISQNECDDFTNNIINLPSWQTSLNSNQVFKQSWRPSSDRSKVFSGEQVLITRELNMSSPYANESLNNSVLTLNYRVEWGGNNEHWLSINLVPEAHGWCTKNI
tara:strand:- start:661 stop:1221 length:561 start_codon:yes stop_codon:yes gene_type:complete